MLNEPSFYAIIPAYVRYNKELSEFEKLLFGEISSLSNKWGYCIAGNQYFSDVYGKGINHISTSISKIQRLGFIRVEILKDKGNERQIYITDIKPPVEIKKKELKDKFEEKIKIEPGWEDEREKFLAYYTEKNDGGRKERWEMEKVFDVGRRWATWMRNQKDWSLKRKTPLPSDEKLREQKKKDFEVEEKKKLAVDPKTPEQIARNRAALDKVRANLKNKMVLK